MKGIAQLRRLFLSTLIQIPMEQARSNTKNNIRKPTTRLDASLVTPFLSQVKLAFLHTLQGVVATPGNAILTTSITTIMLVVMGTFLLAVENVNTSLNAQHKEIRMSIYLRDDITAAENKNLVEAMGAYAEINQIRFIDKAEALKWFSQTIGEAAFLTEGLSKRNPLPASYELTFSPNVLADDFTRLADEFRKFSGIETVQYSRGALSKLGQLLEIVQQVANLGVPIVLALVAFTIFSSTTLSLYGVKSEIEVMRILGAHDLQVCIPYVLESVITGLCASTLALLLLYLGYLQIAESHLEGSLFSIIIDSFHFLSFSSISFLFIVSFLTCAACAFLAVFKFLKRVP